MGAALLTAAAKFIKGLPIWAYVFLGLLIIVRLFSDSWGKG